MASSTGSTPVDYITRFVEDPWRYAPIESMSRDVEVWNASECIWSMHVYGDPDHAWVKAAGFLTAAAPDLYRALETFMDECKDVWCCQSPEQVGEPVYLGHGEYSEPDWKDCGECSGCRATKAARAALEKARGEGYCDECGRKLGDEYCCRTEYDDGE